MTAAIIITALGIWLFLSAWRFYKQIDWDEKPGLTPDTAELRKKEAELMHIQDVLGTAHDQGKVSHDFMRELERFSEAELEQIRSALAPQKR